MSPLYVANYRGGDVNGIGADDVIWLDLDSSTWKALVSDAAAARTVAHDTGAKLLSCEPWDGEPFGDHASGSVASPQPGVLDVDDAHGFVGRLPDEWKMAGGAQS